MNAGIYFSFFFCVGDGFVPPLPIVSVLLPRSPPPFLSLRDPPPSAPLPCTPPPSVPLPPPPDGTPVVRERNGTGGKVGLSLKKARERAAALLYDDQRPRGVKGRSP